MCAFDPSQAERYQCIPAGTAELPTGHAASGPLTAVASLSAPAASKILTTSPWPLDAACISGVDPNCTTTITTTRARNKHGRARRLRMRLVGMGLSASMRALR